jgi:hypothetical protein
MSLTIGDDTISSDRSAHTARLAPGHEQLWEVSWLPGRHLDRNSAITAMVLADVTGPGDVREGHRLWVHVEGWAAELGLTGPDVLTGTASLTGQARAGKRGELTDPEAGG